MTRVSCDEHGFIRGFSYHDGFLDGLLMADDGKSAYLALRSIEGEQRVLTLRNVTALDVQAFWQGNIVHSLRLFPPGLVKGELQQILEKRLYLDAGKLHPDARVFRLTPSYGAEIVAVCGEVEISNVGATLGLTGP